MVRLSFFHVLILMICITFNLPDIFSTFALMVLWLWVGAGAELCYSPRNWPSTVKENQEEETNQSHRAKKYIPCFDQAVWVSRYQEECACRCFGQKWKKRLIFRNALRNWLNPEVIFFLHICAVMFEYHSGRSGCANKTSLQPIYLQQSMSRIPTMSQRLDQEWESECVICNWALIWQSFSAVTAGSLFSPTD